MLSVDTIFTFSPRQVTCDVFGSKNTKIILGHKYKYNIEETN